MEYLQPIKDKDAYADPIAKYIAHQMYEAIFAPLFKILGRKPESTLLSNAFDRSGVHAALQAGTIWFNNDKFYGTFNAAIGKELRSIGARFNSLDKTYFIKAIDLPVHIRASVAQANSKFQAQQNALTNALNKMTLPPQLEFKGIFPKLGDMFIDLNKQYTASIPKGLAVPMVLTENMKEVIAQDYTHNLNLYIKDWYNADIIRLRGRVQESVEEGYRADHMRDVLEAEYGVAERKAKFLARQETSLLVSKYRETRYKESGLSRYRWSTSDDQRVRHDHKKLEGKIFDWDHPPITDEATGDRNNPGEDFNCVPADSNVDLAHGIRKCFRRWYDGELTTIITQSGKTIRGTPNHQVLTQGGWKAIGILNDSDYIVDLSEQLINRFESNINNRIAFIGDIFKSLSKYFGIVTCNDRPINFHGDGAYSNVDIIRTTSCLTIRGKSAFSKLVNNLNFSLPNESTLSESIFFMDIFKVVRVFRNLIFNDLASFACNNSLLTKSKFLESYNISFRSTTNFNTVADQPICDNISSNASTIRNRKNALSGQIRFNDWFNINVNKIMRQFSFPSIGMNSNFSQTFRDYISIKADKLTNLNERFSLIHKFDRVIKSTNGNFSGHVYNLETINNWFTVDGIVYHNCRCVAIPIIE